MNASPTLSASQRRQKFERGLWLLVAVVAATILWYVPETSGGALAASILICIAALFPAWLWIRDGTIDIPIFPLYGLSFVWAYALPMLGEQAYLDEVTETTKLVVGGVISFGLFIGTVTWFWFRQGIASKTGASLQLPIERMKSLLLAAMVANVIFLMGHSGQWFAMIPSEVLTLFRVLITSLYVLAVFVHFYEFGNGRLYGLRALLFIALFAIVELANSVTLLLVGTMISVVIALTAFSLGRGRVPWKTTLVALLAFSLLHAGKAEMREKYWFSNQSFTPQPTEYLGLYLEWVVKGVESLLREAPKEREFQSLRERAGLTYIFFMVYESSPNHVPYLGGESYAPIPRLFVPRFINPEREGTHEGTIILNVHYGLQTRESASTATIGWDLIGEAQANFGIPGVLVAFLILGFTYGRLERWSRGRDIFSFRGMVSLIVLTLAAQSGLTLAVYVTALFQAFVALCLLAIFAMERRQIRDLVDAIRLSGFKAPRQG